MEQPEKQKTYIGVLVYNNTNNVGDWYQTAAALYMWWKHVNSTLTFRNFLNHCMNTGRIGDHPLLWIDRDTISTQPKPADCDRILMIMNAWWMHPLSYATEPKTYHFPPPPFITPIYVSVHIADKQLLTPAAITNFKAHEPVGCRDTDTVQMLTDAGVSAYFSGCLTMTLNLRDERLGFSIQNDYKDTCVWVDVAANTSDKSCQHRSMMQHGEFNRSPGWIGAAVHRMYELRFAKAVVTSRLHVWLPLLANGGTVTLFNNKTDRAFQAEDIKDETVASHRYGGLFELHDPVKLAACKERLLADIQTRIRALL